MARRPPHNSRHKHSSTATCPCSFPTHATHLARRHRAVALRRRRDHLHVRPQRVAPRHLPLVRDGDRHDGLELARRAQHAAREAPRAVRVPLEELLGAALVGLPWDLHEAVAEQQQADAEGKRVAEAERERDEVGEPQRALDNDDADEADDSGGGRGAVQHAVLLQG